MEQNPELKAVLIRKRKQAEEIRKQDPIYVEKWKDIRAQWKQDNAEKIKAQKAARMTDPNYALQLKEKARIRAQDPKRKARKLEMQRLRRANTLSLLL